MSPRGGSAQSAAPIDPKVAAELEAKNAEEAAKKEQEEKGWLRAQVFAKTLKNSMRDPDSFKLSSALVIDETGAICFDYRARNGFGGMNAGHAAGVRRWKIHKNRRNEWIPSAVEQGMRE